MARIGEIQREVTFEPIKAPRRAPQPRREGPKKPAVPLAPKKKEPVKTG